MTPLGPLAQAGVITLLCFGLYFGIRAIPASECAFLHYSAVEVMADGTERCEGGPTPFIDVRRTPFPVRMELISLAELEDGDMEVRLELRGPDGRPLLPHQIAITHTERIHLMLVEEGLAHYHHIHPQPEGDSGVYRATFTPKATQYRYFAEFVPVRTRTLAIADGKLDLKKAMSQPDSTLATKVRTENLQISVQGTEAPVRRNRDTTLTINLKDAAGDPPDLEVIMGAYAHVVAFEESLSGYAHMHPLNPDPRMDDGLEMDFLFHPTRSGRHRVWVQIKLDGVEHYIPFEAEVL